MEDQVKQITDYVWAYVKMQANIGYLVAHDKLDKLILDLCGVAMLTYETVGLAAKIRALPIGRTVVIDDIALKTVAGAIEEAGGYERALSLSTRFLNKSDPLWANAGKITPIEGYQDIVCHGDQFGFVWKNADGIESTVLANEFSQILKDSPVYSGGPIRLVSCETGADGAVAAQAVANKLGVKVMAPSDVVWVLEDGRMVIGPNPSTNTGVWRIFNPQ